jgi:hypothetical protein
MPSVVHNATVFGWDHALTFALNNLTQTPQPTPPGCFGVGGACTYNCMLYLALRSPICTLAIHLGPRQKQADAGIGPAPGNPSVVLEVGDSESLTQLKIDAERWIEHRPEVCFDSLLSYLFSCSVYSLRCQVQLVFLISIDPPPPAHPTTPSITVQLWKGRAPTRPRCAVSAARPREAFMVLEADWSLNAMPVYVLLSDIFGAHPVHAAYGNNDRAVLDTAWLRDVIIRSY